MTRSLRRLALGGLALAAFSGVASPALASHTQESIFQDDGVLGSKIPAVQTGGMQLIRALGASTVRVLVRWDTLAPNPRSSRVPRGNLSSPSAYHGWNVYDHLAQLGHDFNLRVSFDLVGNVPNWAQTGVCHSSSATIRGVCTPSPSRFHQFAVAMGTRYAGNYPDGNGGAIPRVTSWQVWNEPNQAGWLSPQAKFVGRSLVLTSPVLYRRLAVAEISGLAGTGHSSATDRILLADTAPLGASYGRGLDRRNTAPVEFLEGVFCMDNRLHALRGRAARLLACTGRYATLRISGYTHHPYQQGGSFSPLHSVRGDEITIAHANRLERILDGAQRLRRLSGPRPLPIYYTEYGFQTNPPDPLLGLPLAKQAEYINESDWIAFNDNRIAGVAQYELQDDPGVSGFNTGLEFSDGTHKPAFDAYRLPVYVTKSGRGVLVWGQVRASDHTQVQTVAIQTKAGGGWVTQATAETANSNGTPNNQSYFLKKLDGVAAGYRLLWQAADGTTYISRIAQANVH